MWVEEKGRGKGNIGETGAQGAVNENKFVVVSCATSELTAVGGPFSQWGRHLTAMLAFFNVYYIVIIISIKSTIDVDKLSNNMFNSHHRLSIQIPDQEEQQSLRKALRHKDSGGTHLPKNLSAAIKQFIVVVLFSQFSPTRISGFDLWAKGWPMHFWHL